MTDDQIENVVNINPDPQDENAPRNQRARKNKFNACSGSERMKAMYNEHLLQKYA